MSTIFLFAGGGTGGHIYPGLAIAEQLSDLVGPDLQVKFIVSQRPLDGQILQDEMIGGHRVDLIRIDAKPFGTNLSTLWAFWRGWKPAVAKSFEFLQMCAKQGPVHVVAMGGFVSGPVVEAATMLKLPVTLVNLDAIPGKANRWIARRTQHVLSTYPVGEFPKWKTISPIVRRAAFEHPAQEVCKTRFGFSPRAKILFVTGASQGARTINESIVLFARRQAQFLNANGWQILHQTGAGEDEVIRHAYKQADVTAIVKPFIREIGLAWGAADAAISRAGAGSVAEAWANGVPTLFMPYPYHKDQHQDLNAKALTDVGAAATVTDHADSAQNAQALGEAVPKFLDLSSLATRREAFSKLPKADGARQAAQALLEHQEPSTLKA